MIVINFDALPVYLCVCVCVCVSWPPQETKISDIEIINLVVAGVITVAGVVAALMKRL